MFKPRKWQKHAFKVIDNHVSGPVLVNACVGSGKTDVGAYALGEFITSNRSSKTVQIFATPRHRLCDQQNTELEGSLESKFGLKNGPDYEIIPVDCRKNFNKKNDLLVSKHTIFVICDESLWGKDKGPDPAARWHSWLRKFRLWSSKGYKLGWAVLDEAHNYENNEKLMLDDEEDCLAKWFKLMPMSGTPSAFQKEWSKRWRENVCKCSPKEAMENNWICKPTLNLVLGDIDRGLPRAVAAIFNREKKICNGEVFKSNIVINCSGIDQINRLVELDWMKEHAGKDFHFITLHSTKVYDDGDGRLARAEPTIDCKVVEADEAYSAIESIDNGSFFKDDLPIIVAQVAMLGEGINVRSFNAILTMSNTDKTVMQQIGRGIRNYSFNGKEKVIDGHANVYVLTDNVMAVKQLLINLEEYDLTDECFSWGDKLDIMTGSGLEDIDDGRVPELNSFAWDPIDPEHDLDIIELMTSMNNKRYKRAGADTFNRICELGTIKKFEDLLVRLSKTGKIKLWDKPSFSKRDIVAKRKERTEDVKATKKDSKVVKKSETKRSNQSYDYFMSWLFDIRNSVKSSESMKKLWSLDRTLCIEAILRDKEVAEFYVENIPAENFDLIVK